MNVIVADPAQAVRAALHMIGSALGLRLPLRLAKEVRVEFDPDLHALGTFTPGSGVCLKTGLDVGTMFTVLVHEVAHFLDWRAGNTPWVSTARLEAMAVWVELAVFPRLAGCYAAHAPEYALPDDSWLRDPEGCREWARKRLQVLA